MEQEIEILKSRGIDQSTLATSLKQERVRQQENMAQMKEVLFSSIKSLEKEIAEINSKLPDTPGGGPGN